jgi:hypothetical protein
MQLGRTRLVSAGRVCSTGARNMTSGMPDMHRCCSVANYDRSVTRRLVDCSKTKGPVLARSVRLGRQES